MKITSIIKDIRNDITERNIKTIEMFNDELAKMGSEIHVGYDRSESENGHYIIVGDKDDGYYAGNLEEHPEVVAYKIAERIGWLQDR